VDYGVHFLKTGSFETGVGASLVGLSCKSDGFHRLLRTERCCVKNGKKCRCLYAVLTAVVVILLITYIWGYSIGDWTLATWLAAAVIVVTSLLCVICRQRRNNVE